MLHARQIRYTSTVWTKYSEQSHIRIGNRRRGSYAQFGTNRSLKVAVWKGDIETAGIIMKCQC